eukprot:jgi/Mesvir1/27451/Mv07236-RA.1
MIQNLEDSAWYVDKGDLPDNSGERPLLLYLLRIIDSPDPAHPGGGSGTRAVLLGAVRAAESFPGGPLGDRVKLFMAGKDPVLLTASRFSPARLGPFGVVQEAAWRALVAQWRHLPLPSPLLPQHGQGGGASGSPSTSSPAAVPALSRVRGDDLVVAMNASLGIGRSASANSDIPGGVASSLLSPGLMQRSLRGGASMIIAEDEEAHPGGWLVDFDVVSDDAHDMNVSVTGGGAVASSAVGQAGAEVSFTQSQNGGHSPKLQASGQGSTGQGMGQSDHSAHRNDPPRVRVNLEKGVRMFLDLGGDELQDVGRAVRAAVAPEHPDTLRITLAGQTKAVSVLANLFEFGQLEDEGIVRQDYWRHLVGAARGDRVGAGGRPALPSAHAFAEAINASIMSAKDAVDRAQAAQRLAEQQRLQQQQLLLQQQQQQYAMQQQQQMLQRQQNGFAGPGGLMGGTLPGGGLPGGAFPGGLPLSPAGVGTRSVGGTRGVAARGPSQPFPSGALSPLAAAATLTAAGRMETLWPNPWIVDRQEPDSNNSNNDDDNHAGNAAQPGGGLWLYCDMYGVGRIDAAGQVLAATVSKSSGALSSAGDEDMVKLLLADGTTVVTQSSLFDIAELSPGGIAVEPSWVGMLGQFVSTGVRPGAVELARAISGSVQAREGGAAAMVGGTRGVATRGVGVPGVVGAPMAPVTMTRNVFALPGSQVQFDGQSLVGQGFGQGVGGQGVLQGPAGTAPMGGLVDLRAAIWCVDRVWKGDVTPVPGNLDAGILAEAGLRLYLDLDGDGSLDDAGQIMAATAGVLTGMLASVPGTFSTASPGEAYPIAPQAPGGQMPGVQGAGNGAVPGGPTPVGPMAGSAGYPYANGMVPDGGAGMDPDVLAVVLGDGRKFALHSSLFDIEQLEPAGVRVEAPWASLVARFLTHGVRPGAAELAAAVGASAGTRQVAPEYASGPSMPAPLLPLGAVAGAAGPVAGTRGMRGVTAAAGAGAGHGGASQPRAALSAAAASITAGAQDLRGAIWTVDRAMAAGASASPNGGRSHANANASMSGIANASMSLAGWQPPAVIEDAGLRLFMDLDGDGTLDDVGQVVRALAVPEDSDHRHGGVEGSSDTLMLILADARRLIFSSSSFDIEQLEEWGVAIEAPWAPLVGRFQGSGRQRPASAELIVAINSCTTGPRKFSIPGMAGGNNHHGVYGSPAGMSSGGSSPLAPLLSKAWVMERDRAEDDGSVILERGLRLFTDIDGLDDLDDTGQVASAAVVMQAPSPSHGHRNEHPQGQGQGLHQQGQKKASLGDIAPRPMLRVMLIDGRSLILDPADFAPEEWEEGGVVDERPWKTLADRLAATGQRPSAQELVGAINASVGVRILDPSKLGVHAHQSIASSSPAPLPAPSPGGPTQPPATRQRGAPQMLAPVHGGSAPAGVAVPPSGSSLVAGGGEHHGGTASKSQPAASRLTAGGGEGVAGGNEGGGGGPKLGTRSMVASPRPPAQHVDTTHGPSHLNSHPTSGGGSVGGAEIAVMDGSIVPDQSERGSGNMTPRPVPAQEVLAQGDAAAAAQRADHHHSRERDHAGPRHDGLAGADQEGPGTGGGPTIADSPSPVPVADAVLPRPPRSPHDATNYSANVRPGTRSIVAPGTGAKGQAPSGRPPSPGAGVGGASVTVQGGAPVTVSEAEWYVDYSDKDASGRQLLLYMDLDGQDDLDEAGVVAGASRVEGMPAVIRLSMALRDGGAPGVAQGEAQGKEAAKPKGGFFSRLFKGKAAKGAAEAAANAEAKQGGDVYNYTFVRVDKFAFGQLADAEVVAVDAAWAAIKESAFGGADVAPVTVDALLSAIDASARGAGGAVAAAGNAATGGAAASVAASGPAVSGSNASDAPSSAARHMSGAPQPAPAVTTRSAAATQGPSQVPGHSSAGGQGMGSSEGMDGREAGGSAAAVAVLNVDEGEDEDKLRNLRIDKTYRRFKRDDESDVEGLSSHGGGEGPFAHGNGEGLSGHGPGKGEGHGHRGVAVPTAPVPAQTSQESQLHPTRGSNGDKGVPSLDAGSPDDDVSGDVSGAREDVEPLPPTGAAVGPHDVKDDEEEEEEEEKNTRAGKGAPRPGGAVQQGPSAHASMQRVPGTSQGKHSTPEKGTGPKDGDGPGGSEEDDASIVSDGDDVMDDVDNGRDEDGDGDRGGDGDERGSGPPAAAVRGKQGGPGGKRALKPPLGDGGGDDGEDNEGGGQRRMAVSRWPLMTLRSSRTVTRAMMRTAMMSSRCRIREGRTRGVEGKKRRCPLGPSAFSRWEVLVGCPLWVASRAVCLRFSTSQNH